MGKKLLTFFAMPLWFLASCSDPVEAAGKISQVIMNPDIPVGDKSNQASKVRLSFYATAEVNPNLNSMPSPLRIQIYQIKSPHIFMNSDYYSMVEDPKATLDTTYINHEEYEISPDTWLPVEEIELNKNTKAIAVIGLYSDVDQTQWRAVMPVKSQGDEFDFLILAEKRQIRIVENKPSDVKDSKAIKEAERKARYQDHHTDEQESDLDSNKVYSVPKPEPKPEPKWKSKSK